MTDGRKRRWSRRDLEGHWDEIYATRPSHELGWYEPAPSTLELVTAHSTPPNSVIDVGAGDGRLIDELLDRGYRDVTVLDVSGEALERARARLGRVPTRSSRSTPTSQGTCPRRPGICGMTAPCSTSLSKTTTAGRPPGGRASRLRFGQARDRRPFTRQALIIALACQSVGTPSIPFQPRSPRPSRWSASTTSCPANRPRAISAPM